MPKKDKFKSITWLDAGLVLLVAGILSLLQNLNVIPLSPAVLPVVFIFIGLSFILYSALIK